MKKTLSILLAFFISNTAYANCQHAEPVAEQFLNAYVKVTNSDTWLMRHSQLTKNFKNAYKKLLADAKRENPDMGLDFDPIFNAQDYPEQGFKVNSCNEKTNTVTLSGKQTDWQNFQVKIKVINTPKGWFIDGAGVINMPK